MDDALRSQLHDLALDARRLLTNETRSILTAVYGLSSEGRFEAVTKLPAVQSMPEVAETRRRLERFVRDEAAAGRKGAEAIERLVRETAFTHLNRLVAFKLLEARKLIRGTLDKYHASNGFLFYVNDHPEDNARYEAGDMPKDAIDEGPRDHAYRHFLLWQAAQLAPEVPVLFDSANLPSRLFPRPRALRELLDKLNSPELREAWAVGNEETIGWVYQYFNEEEKDAVFVRLNKQKQKIRREDLPAATQLFTPRWIVRFLVENTLGRHWMQMHPDSGLGAELEYLVPLAGEIPPVPLKLARELTLLDPACGTMHFGLLAFDLFAAMYREELEHAGEPGWPAQPSVDSPDAIPAAILANNLFGIDIDLRAVQLAALSLYVRAKAQSPKAIVTPRNLVCADVTVLNGNRLGAFVDALGHTKPAVETAIRALWPRLKQAGELGSLLRLEDDMRSLFITSRSRKAQKGILSLPGYEEVDAGQFRTTELDAEVRTALNAFARQEADRGDDATAFVAGAEQGLKLLDLLARRYDIVVANPPYMSVRGMPPTLADFLKAAYPEGKGDLYAAFIQRCAELLAPAGRLGMITQQSFMFISSYEKLREQLRSSMAIEAMAHVGPRAFAEIGGEKVNTTIFALRREGNEPRRQDSIGTYFRLVREPDAEAKRVAFEQAVSELNHRGTKVQSVFRYRQGDFDTIPGAPWVYWMQKGIHSLFLTSQSLEDVGQPRAGLNTCDNFRFLRNWWELGRARLGTGYTSVEKAKVSGYRWFPYMKGGRYKKWYGNQNLVINWSNDGLEVKQYALTTSGTTHWSRYVRNPQYYFKVGVTWSDIAVGKFNARISPGGFMFDMKGSSAFPDKEKLYLILALLNSEFAQYTFNLLNPTVSFQVGDLARLPIPTQTSETLNGLVERAIALAKEDSAESEATYDFDAPPAWPTGGADVAARHAELAAVEREIDEEVYRLYGIAGDDRKAIEAEIADKTMLADADEDAEAAPADEEESADESALTREALARRWLSYALGVALGRFQPGVEGAIGRGRFDPKVAAQLRALADEDGLGLIEPGHPDDLGARVERALELMLGEEEAPQLIGAATGGKPLAAYLTGEFYKEHARQYRKRPVYWLLQSPRRTFSMLLFHERLTGDSLPLILGNRYIQGRINTLRGRLGELQARASDAPPGRARKAAERERDEAADLLTDVEELARLVRALIEQTNERGEVVGWRPAIDDGVLINMAPLHTLIPAWAAEPRKCWQALERGDYDWSHTAMRYWPDRVLATCRTNRSYAIAHGIDG